MIAPLRWSRRAIVLGACGSLTLAPALAEAGMRSPPVMQPSPAEIPDLPDPSVPAGPSGHSGHSGPAEAPAPSVPAWESVSLPGARQLNLRSDATGHRYRIFVAAPPGAVPEAGYPVLFVLDGNAAFPVAALLARQVASRAEVTGHVAPLVVGIGYPGDIDYDREARQRDYTPGGMPLPGATADGGGGANAFMDFIDRQLRPFIAGAYRIDAQRQALFGHSFGGLFVLHALFTRPGMFSTYLASSPSIWWRGQLVLAELGRSTGDALSGGAGPRVQISVGALEDDAPRGRVTPEVRALLERRTMVEPARALAARLRRMPGAEERVAFHELAGENHGSAWLPAMTRGLQFFMEQPAGVKTVAEPHAEPPAEPRAERQTGAGLTGVELTGGTP